MPAPWVESLLSASLRLKRGERVLIMHDAPLLQAGEALAAGALEMGAVHVQRVLLPEPGRGLAVVPTALTEAAGRADLLLSLRSQLDLSGEDPHIRAAMSAFLQGGRGRWGSLAQVDQEVLEEALSGDPGAVAREAERLAARVRRHSAVRITSDTGTDLSLSYAGRPVHVETGVIDRPGTIGNLPGGEVFVAPLEQSAEGRLVVDLCLGDLLLDQPVCLTFQRGRVVAVEGGQAAQRLRQRLGRDDWAWTIGEFGLGANPHIRRRGRVALDEKALGTAHIALGANRSFGGVNPAETHYDCVLAEPRIEFPGA
ncbi:MAG: aminopeptidase [Bacillota bacterium]